jgi:hypothetical protein
MVSVQAVIAARVREVLNWFLLGMHAFLAIMNLTAMAIACAIKVRVLGLYWLSES